MESNPSPYDGTNALTSAQVGATTAQKMKISEVVKFDPQTCGASSVSPGTQTGDWSENWADEWARLMYQQDGGAPSAEGVQNITTYSIAVVNESIQNGQISCKPDYPALMTTMAEHGGGKYFKTSSAAEIATALASILNEVQAVNSVFSSASLPVSVNAEGSYLNQIYLGMFRPDASGAPRWLGNLKQYQLIKGPTGTLVLGDAQTTPGPQAAISSAGTGFISPNAVSFWTSTNTARPPDDAGGFYTKDPKGVPKSGFDSPDGEVVEKGGAAQQMRLESLVADFGATAGSAANPRRLYTHCPSGIAPCINDLTDSANQFSVANTGIGAAAFGASSTVRVNSIVRTGTSALVTTSGNHGFSSGTTVTISNAAPSDYNVTQAVTVNSPTTFTITGLTDYPTSPSAGGYTVSAVASSPASVVSITRMTSTSGSKNSETATLVTTSAHGFTTSSPIVVSGASPTEYSYSGKPASVPGDNTLTFTVDVHPPASAANTYQVTLSPSAYPAINNVTVANATAGEISGSTTNAHNLHVGQTITISGAGNKYNGIYTVATALTSTTFTVLANLKNLGSINTATVTPDTSTRQPIAKLTRVATTASSAATAVVTAGNFFGNGIGSTKIVNIAKATGSAADESAYEQSNATITCASVDCTTFTYPIATTAVSATGTITVVLSGATNVSVLPGKITRSGATATVSGVPGGTFFNHQDVSIAPSGSALSAEAAYVGTWTISCTSPCTSFTFGPVSLSPDTPATGANIQAYSASTPPDRDTIIKWFRGADNVGDEKGPGGSVTVRPSIHGDVLHSRPLVVNYGDSRGIVVFYGANDGVFRAVNGNKTAPIKSIPAGGELWGLVLPEHFGSINRLRLNSPELKFPSTFLSSAQPKNYFIDGATGSYQKLKADGTIDKAYLFLTMRRGGRMIYALDVSEPTKPVYMWSIDPASPGFEELGQTWSRPRVTLLQRDAALGTANPVLVFGAGYAPDEDTEPPSTDAMGRGIFVVDALKGSLIWSATPSCTTSATCLQVKEMTHAVPSDIAFVDRDRNGYTDKFYFPDLGGNIWRADVADSFTSNWTVTRLAALGCDTGTCAPGTTPRKFFFPPSVLSIKASGTSGSYDAIAIASGDREHPLKSKAAQSSYNVKDRFFMIKDTGTDVGKAGTSEVTAATLFDATSRLYDDSQDGFYKGFNPGEKAVNAPLAVNGSIFFATNTPLEKTQTCVANLGQATAYAVSPFSGSQVTNVLQGGGLAPSAVTGLITIETRNGDGPTTTSEEKFCIGCGISAPGSAPCRSSLDQCSFNPAIPKNLRRTYWYKK